MKARSVLICLSIIFSSCTYTIMSYKKIPPGPEGALNVGQVHPGDLLQLNMKNDERIYKFKVLEIDSTKISGIRLYKGSKTPDSLQSSETIRMTNIKVVKMGTEVVKEAPVVWFFYLGVIFFAIILSAF